MNPYSFTRYLTAKKSVDDRSLNRYVWDTLAGLLAGRDAPLRVLEVGAGIGTMIARTLEWGLFQGEVFYTAIDEQADNTAEALRYLTKWATEQGVKAADCSSSRLTLSNQRCTLHSTFHTADAFAYIDAEVEAASYDLLIANAFIDLVHIPTALAILFSTLKPGGLFYLTVTFDGVTAFEPPVDGELDTQIEVLYHADMEKRRWVNQPTGGSLAGRRLLRYLLKTKTEVLAAGASDWVVIPQAGGYQADEAAFLHAIIHTIDTALTGNPELSAGQFAAWVDRRHQQIDDGELVYITHQLDVLGRV